MGFEGQKEGFAPLKLKFIRGISHLGVQYIDRSLKDPIVQSSHKERVDSNLVTAITTSIHEESVE